jgi:hypothetical protein
MSDLLNALAMVRRYITAIAEGRIEGKAVAAMTDDQLIEFDAVMRGELEAAQAEAEGAAGSPE